MFDFRNISIKGKLVLIQVFTTIVVLALCFSAFIFTDIKGYKQRKIKSTVTMLQLISTSSASTLQFMDNASAKGILSELHVQDDIANAAILDRNGKIFAAYSKDPVDSFRFAVTKVPVMAAPKYSDNYLIAYNNIVKDNELVGAVCMRVELSQLQELIRIKYQVGAYLLIIGIALALLISVFVQQYVSKPLLNFVEVMQIMKESGDYKNRADVRGKDEIGALALMFNSLLDQIEKRDNELETRVKERTAELVAVNMELEANTNQLRESEEQIQTIFQSAPDAVIVIDEDGCIVRWNPRAEEVFGWTFDEVAGKLLHEIIIPEKYRDAHQNGLKHFLKTKEGPVLNRPVELTAVRKDQTEFDVGLRISPTILKGKYYFIGFVRDISFRKKAEEEIVQTNRFLDTILENIPNMVFVKDAEELRFVRFNKAGEKLLGFKRQDLIGKNDYDFFPHEQADFFTAKDKEVFINGDIRDIPEEPIETKTGKRWLHTRKVPILNTDGKPGYLLGISEDITEQKKALEEIKRSQQQFLSIFNLSPVPMMISSAETAKIIRVNKAWENLFLMKQEEVVGKSSVEIKMISAEERAEKIQYIMEHGGKVTGMEGKVRIASGELKDVYTSIEILELDEKKCIVAALIDITERKKLESELERKAEDLASANKELESFSYSVSHDLRAPLRAITGYSNIMLEDYGDKLEKEAKEYLYTIVRNTDRMGQLIDDILSFSRLSRRDVSKFSLNMHSIFSDTFNELMSSQPKGRKVKFTLDELKNTSGDKAMITQVVTNLLSNALKFTRARKTTEIHAGGKEMNGEYVYFVEDNGVGFDERHKEKLFGVFQRLHRDEEFEGTGVGLAIVQRVIHRHGGNVWAHSELNKGTVFYFTLPAKGEEQKS